MYRFDGFTEKANNALNLALTSAEDMGHTYICLLYTSRCV